MSKRRSQEQKLRDAVAEATETARAMKPRVLNTLECYAMQQSHEDAEEIVQILTAAFTDFRIPLDLRQRLAAVKERAERIVRNTAESTP